MIEVFKDAEGDLTERRVCLRPGENEVLLSGGPARIVRSGGRLLRGRKPVNNLKREGGFSKMPSYLHPRFVDAGRSERLY